MRNFLILSVIAMLSAGIYGAIDMSTDIMHGKMINYEKGESKGPIAVEDYSRGEPNYDASTTAPESVPATVSSVIKLGATTTSVDNEPPAVLPLVKVAKKATVKPSFSNLSVRSFGRGDISRFSLADSNVRYIAPAIIEVDSSMVLTSRDSTAKESTVEK